MNSTQPFDPEQVPSGKWNANMIASHAQCGVLSDLVANTIRHADSHVRILLAIAFMSAFALRFSRSLFRSRASASASLRASQSDATHFGSFARALVTHFVAKTALRETSNLRIVRRVVCCAQNHTFYCRFSSFSTLPAPLSTRFALHIYISYILSKYTICSKYV